MNLQRHSLWQARVGLIESGSCAEVVVAEQAQADAYSDGNWKWAVLASLLTLLVMVHSPIVFHPEGLILNTVFAGALGYLASWRAPWLRRWLTSARRRREQAERSADLAFTRLEVSHTRERVGLLLLVCRFEQVALLRPDLGLTGRVPGARWNQLQGRLDAARGLDQLEKTVTEVLEELAPLLHEQAPRAAGDQNELSDQVRILC